MLLDKDWEAWLCWGGCGLARGSAEVWNAQARPRVLFLLLPDDLDAGLSSIPSTVPACVILCFLPWLMDSNSGTVNQPQFNIVLYESCHGHGVSSQQQNSNWGTYVFACMYICSQHAFPGIGGSQKRAPDPLGLDRCLWAIIWVIEVKPGLSGRVASILNCWGISPAHGA